MKNKLILISILTGVALVAGCNRSAKESAVQVGEGIARKTETIPAAAPTETPALQNYTFAQQDAFTAAMRTRLADSNRHLDAMNAKVENAGDPLKTEGKPMFDALRKQAATLNSQLDGLRSSTAGTWNGDRSDALATYSALQTGLDQAHRWVSDKIAP